MIQVKKLSDYLQTKVYVLLFNMSNLSVSQNNFHSSKSLHKILVCISERSEIKKFKFIISILISFYS
jgi:hypothetical protein